MEKAILRERILRTKDPPTERSATLSIQVLNLHPKGKAQEQA
jgi:hypothetical protein